MKEKNICKIIYSSATEELHTSLFIFESDAQVQEDEKVLEKDRIYLISHGSGRFRIDRTEYEVCSGDLLFGFAGERVCAHGKELEYFYIDFSGSRANELYRRFGVAPAFRRFGGHEKQIPFWRENISCATEDTLDIVSESVLMYAFSKLSVVRESVPDVARLMAEYAEENFSDAELSLQFLAEEWGYNPKYLSESFKKRMGMGFSRYLKNLRVKHAVFLMEHGVVSIKNVAFLCGFRDPLYFSKVFRADMGISPKEYLQR